MTYEEGNQDNKGFVVKDKRRFDEAGNRREPTEELSGNTSSESTENYSKPEVSKVSSQQDNSNSQNTAGAQAQNKPAYPESVDFATFIMSLASQALLQLGVVPPPPGVSVDVNPQASKYTIDIIGLIQEKTKGNLDENEEKLLKGMLHDLRMQYVKAVEENNSEKK